MVELIIKEDEVSKSLRGKGFFLGALLHDIRSLDIGSMEMNNSQIYLTQEILRLDNLFAHFDRCEFLPLVDQGGSAVKDVVIPLVRVALEGFFRVRYLFCDALKNQYFDPELLNIRFSKIVDNFSFEYEKITKEQDLEDLQLEALERKKVAARWQEVSLNQIRSETVCVLKDLDAGEDRKLYAFYRYCCFYAHGNLNAGITNEAGLKEFLTFDLDFFLESMASNYLKSFSIMLKGNPLQGRIEEALSKSLVNNPC